MKPPMAADDFQIHNLTEAHRAAWQPLWDGYLRFYRDELDDTVTDSTFARLCDSSTDMSGLIAISREGDPGGLAHLVFHPSTWETSPVCYLEDLFVARPARGSGLAQRLLDAVYELAADVGAVAVYWHTQQFNGAARSLYDTVAQLQSWVVYEHKL
jgi:GNAT superfamily N-acetyltransferase